MLRLGCAGSVALALASCGYSTYYPHPVGLTDDTGGTSVLVPCGFAGETEVSLTLLSSYPLTQNVYEVDPTTCAEAFRAELWSGGSALFPTRSGVTWVSRGPDGEVLGFFAVPDGNAEWTEVVP